MWYTDRGAWKCAGAASSGRRGPLHREEAELHMLFPPPLHGRGVMEMVTYSDLFQLGILIVNIITLVVQINKKTK